MECYICKEKVKPDWVSVVTEAGTTVCIDCIEEEYDDKDYPYEET